MKKVKIVIGANAGDESKGLITHYFAKTAINPLVVFHNGSAQRGHTVDYNPKFRHVYHHFGSGTAEGVPTQFTKTFWLHPMEFHREYLELQSQGIVPPICYADPEAPIITPFDMLVDHITEAYIAYQKGEREYGSCGYGTWCAIEDRKPDTILHYSDLAVFDIDKYYYWMEEAWCDCLRVIAKRKIDLDKVPQYFDILRNRRENILESFKHDLQFMYSKTVCMPFDKAWKVYDNIIFENGQGLMLDKDADSEWHSTSSTGLKNPYELLKDKEDFEAEVCYVSRAYMTRHGIGPMDNEAQKKEINGEMHDRTNVPNEFQGSLRYGYVEDKELKKRIEKDWAIATNDKRFVKSMAITHCNEFPDIKIGDYMSNNPFSVIKI